MTPRRSPLPDRPEGSVEVNAHPGLEVRLDRAEILGAHAHTARQDVTRVVQGARARHRIEDGSAVEQDRRWTEGALHGSILGYREAAILVHPPRHLPSIVAVDDLLDRAGPAGYRHMNGVGRSADDLLGSEHDAHVPQQGTFSLEAHDPAVHRHREVQLLVAERLAANEL